MDYENKLNIIGLIKKLITRFKTSKLVRKIEALTIAGAVALSLASCEYLPTPNDPPYNDNGGNNNNNNGENNNNNNNNNNGQNEIDWSKYSQLLQNVLNSPEYDNLISNYTDAYGPNKYNRYQGHPYAFLEEEGYNIDDIKNDLLKCETKSYVFENDPNNLYIITKVETKEAEIPYYTEYILKYTLTEQEMSDYDYLHREFSSYAPFLNQELSKMKDPEVVNEIRCTITAHDGLISAFKDSSALKKILKELNCLNGEKVQDVVLLNFQSGPYPFEVMLISNNYASEHSMITNCKIDSFNLIYNYDYVRATSDNAFCKPYSYGGFLFDEGNTSNYNNAKCYYTHDIIYVKNDIRHKLINNQD